MSARRRRRPFAGWRKNAKEGTKKTADCGSNCLSAPDCTDCGCGGLLLATFTLLTALSGYTTTPPVHEGALTIRPLLRLIRSYQTNVSAHRPAVCNLTPTCSRYGYTALTQRGPRGLLDITRRLRQCRDAASPRDHRVR